MTPRRGVRRLNIAFAVELTWLLASGLAGSILITVPGGWGIGASEVLASGYGEAGIGPQVFGAYRVIGLIGVKLTRGWRIHRLLFDVCDRCGAW